MEGLAAGLRGGRAAALRKQLAPAGSCWGLVPHAGGSHGAAPDFIHLPLPLLLPGGDRPGAGTGLLRGGGGRNRPRPSQARPSPCEDSVPRGQEQVSSCTAPATAQLPGIACDTLSQATLGAGGNPQPAYGTDLTGHFSSEA